MPLQAILAARRGHRLPPDGSTLVVAFSGGPDSAALLHALARAGHWHLLAIHVDHRMRPDSAGDAAQAERLAAGLGVRCQVVRLGEAPRGEGEARDARHAALAAVARTEGAAAIALGHTADDQLETLLLRLTRGTGLTGLKGMGGWEPGPAGVLLARPLLDVSREEVEAYVASVGIQAIEDPTNRDPAFADRNLVRSRVVPVLRELNPRVAEAAGRSARLLADEDAALDAWCAREHAALAAGSGSPEAFPLRQFRLLPLAVRRRLVRRVAGGLTFEQVEQVLGLAASEAPGHTHLPGGRIASKAGGRLQLSPGPASPGSGCRICLTQGGPVPSMEREFGIEQGPGSR